jgi:hypothetical protein
MPINLELLENGHILHFQVDGAWTPEEIVAGKEKVRRIFQEARHIVHALVDLRKARVSVPLLMASQQVIGGEPLPNSGQIAVIGVSWIMRSLAEPILRLAGGADTVLFFNTIDEAKAYLRRFIEQETPR